MDNIEQASQRLFKAYQQHFICPPVRDLIGETDLSIAYQVQEKFQHAISQIDNNPIIGHKIGVTTFTGQKSFGISNPVYASLFQKMELDNNIEVDFANFNSPKIEVEIAFILKKNINSFVSTAQLMQSIDWVAPAFEIPDSRMNWDVKITDMVADNIGASHFVLGHDFKRANKIDFVNCHMQLLNNGKLIADGVGGVCLGSPLNSLRWLANELVANGKSLLSGETIIAGALAPMLAIKAGDKLEATISGLGKVKTEIV